MKGWSVQTLDDYRELAAKCRRLADDIHIDLVARGLRDLADEYEIMAIDAPAQPAANDSRQD